MNSWDFKLLYDGNCPICRAEVRWLKSRDKHGRLTYQDINDDDFHAEERGLTHATLMAVIHGEYPDGRIVREMEAFRAAYQTVGLGWMLAITRVPLLLPIFDRLYLLFAKYRLPLGARLSRNDCDQGVCGLPDQARDK